jgi:hypothetical protein
MAFDGFSHLVSDLYGIGQGFRNSKTWLAILTNYSFSPSFYTGDAWGSYNSIMRLLTGTLFGIGIVWFGFPYLDTAFSPPHQDSETGRLFQKTKHGSMENSTSREQFT